MGRIESFTTRLKIGGRLWEGALFPS